MAKEKDAELIKLYGQIQNCNYSTTSSSASKSDNSYDTLNNELDTVIQNLGIKSTWDDAVSVEINGGLKSGFDGMILSCKIPAGEIISKAGVTVGNLISSIKTYSDKVDAYNKCENDLSSMRNNPPSQRNDDGTINSAYTQWETAKYSLEGQLNTLDSEVESWLSSSKSLVGTVKGLLSAIGSETSSAALSTIIGTTELYEGSSVEEFGYGDGYTISGTVVKDENGNIVSETYYIKNAAGVIVQSGMVTYNPDGTKNIENYIKKPEVPTTTEELAEKKAELKDKKIPEAQVYVDEDIVPEEENVSSNTDVSEDGTEYTTNSHVEKKFTDGVVLKTEITEKGAFAEIVLESGETKKVPIPKTALEKGEFVLDGVKYNFEKMTTFDSKGARDYSTSTLTGEDGNAVAKVDTDYVADYTDRVTGCDVDVQNKMTDTENSTTTEFTTTYTSPSDGEIHVDGVTVIRDKNDPSCGTVTNSDGSGYDISRNEKGELIVTERYEDKNGNMVTGEPTVIPDKSDSTFSVTGPDGETKTYELNMSNPMDEFLVKNEYQTAKIESGYDPFTALEGCHHLWDGDGDPVSVESPLSEEGSGYTFALQYKGE